MATPTPKSAPRPRTKAQTTPQRPPASDAPEVVNPIWLLKAVGGTIVAALVCGYLTLCLLFYQGQWQFVLHPSRTGAVPATIDGTAVQTIHFGVDESALPQLTGWLIPTEPTARYAAYTVLYLPSGDGSLADALPTLTALHSLGINIFAFDYRGYGQSAATRPNQRRMTEDATSAWQLLTVSRATTPSRIVLFGDGVGCSLAAQLAAAHPEVPAIILQSPRPAIILDVLADPRVQSLPARLLFHENFELTSRISTLKTPKLFLLNGEGQSQSASAPEVQHLTTASDSPKMVATMPRGDFYGPLYREQIVRFLDQYLR
jgi:pimeloyl-ACP methyl ester carboxylesterase